MVEWYDAMRAAYFEAFGGTFTVKPAREHLADTFGHLSRCALRAVDAAYSHGKKNDNAGARSAALAAFKSEVFDQWLQANLTPEEYAAIQRQAADVRAYRDAQRL